MMKHKQETPIQKVRPIRDVHTPVATGQPRKHVARRSKISGYLRLPLVRVGIVLLVVVLGAVFTRNYIQTRDQMIYNDPVKLTAKVGHFLELPTDETATLATVKDVNKLRGQSFFQHAQDGDKVLIFTKSGKAVLYRPSTQKVIEYTPINLNATPK